MSIAAAKRTLTGSACATEASVWRRSRLAARLSIDVGADRVVLRCGAATRVFVDEVQRIDGRGGLAECPVAPAVVSGLVDAWPALREDWSVGALSRFDARGRAFEVDGGPWEARRSLASARVSLADYARYCENDGDGDDAPLYVFDSGNGVPDAAGLEPTPACFADDALPELLGSRDDRQRPLPRRWLLVGAKRSGTPVHDHPLTAAWNVASRGS